MARQRHDLLIGPFGHIDESWLCPSNEQVSVTTNNEHRLLGVDFNTDAAFPPDDTGHGFDTSGDVLDGSHRGLVRVRDGWQPCVGAANFEKNAYRAENSCAAP